MVPALELRLDRIGPLAPVARHLREVGVRRAVDHGEPGSASRLRSPSSVGKLLPEGCSASCWSGRRRRAGRGVRPGQRPAKLGQERPLIGDGAQHAEAPDHVEDPGANGRADAACTTGSPNIRRAARQAPGSGSLSTGVDADLAGGERRWTTHPRRHSPASGRAGGRAGRAASAGLPGLAAPRHAAGTRYSGRGPARPRTSRSRPCRTRPHGVVVHRAGSPCGSGGRSPPGPPRIRRPPRRRHPRTGSPRPRPRWPSRLRPRPPAISIPAATGSAAVMTASTAAGSISSPGSAVSTAADRASVKTATDATTGMLSPSDRAAVTNARRRPRSDVVQHGDTRSGPLLLDQSSRPERRPGARSAPRARRPAGPSTSPARPDRVPSRSNTWVTSGRTSNARPSPVTHSTVARPS